MKTYFITALPLLCCVWGFYDALIYDNQLTYPANPLFVDVRYDDHSLPVADKVTVQKQYVCSPCGNDCDKHVYDKPGTCTECGMTLIDKSTIGFTDIDFATVCARLRSNPKVVLLDVRSPGEFSGTSTEVPTFGHLKNAINVNITELESRIAELNKFKDQEVIVYCSHSHRSPRASYYLATHGFKNVKNVAGGVSTLGATVPACLENIYIKHAR